MPTATPPIYLGTVLLEPNRWSPGKLPSFKVSEWSAAIKQAGFDGLELWENHAALADEAERQALATGPTPVCLLNTYAGFANADHAAREQAVSLAQRFKVSGVKFNFGRDPALVSEYLANLRQWAERLPPQTRLLCECHGQTVLEEPEAAARRIHWVHVLQRHE